MSWEIDFYETTRGSSPPKDFLLGLPPKARAKVIRTLDLLEEFGPMIGEPYVKSMRGWPGLFELRTTLGSDAYRLFFFQAGQDRIVITHGIRKKTDRTPQRDLETAASRMRAYLDRG